MGMAAILDMWTLALIINLLPLTKENSIWNLKTIGLLVSKKTMF